MHASPHHYQKKRTLNKAHGRNGERAQMQTRTTLLRLWKMDQWALRTTSDVRPEGRRVRRRENTEAQPAAGSLADTLRSQGPGRNGPRRYQDLLEATARLSLDTARVVRRLQATVLRTVTVPDSSLGGAVLKKLALRERVNGTEDLAILWAQLI